MKPLCIYHGNCADGFGAAWVVRKALGDVDFHAGVYQDAPPDVSGRHVIMVDFSYKRDVLLKMAERSAGVLILDHHKSAADDLTPDAVRIGDLWKYTGALSWNRFLDDCVQDNFEGAPWGRVYSLFDLNHSGARMAWDFFFPNAIRPPLIDVIEDRDLWRFALDGTREIQAALFSYAYDFEVWDKLMAQKSFELNQDMRREGMAIERKHFKDIAELVKVCRREMTIGGIVVPVASLPYTLTSDAGHLMATEHSSKIGACYWDTPQGRVFSLRSTDDGPDVSEIAKQYGGGGHPHASGFRVPYGHELA